MANIYSVYNRRTDMPVYIHGTAAECSAAMGIGVKTFYTYILRARKGCPHKKYEIFIDEDDEEDPDGEE